MNVTDSFAHLEELFVLFNRVLKLAKVIIQDTSRVVRTALVSRFTSPFAGKCQHVIIFQAFLC